MMSMLYTEADKSVETNLAYIHVLVERKSAQSFFFRLKPLLFVSAFQKLLKS